MKFKIVGLFLSFVLIVMVAVNLPKQEMEYDYLRLHIRANSNTEQDQRIKYEIKDLMIEFLSPILCDVESKQKAIEIINELKNDIQFKCIQYLKKRSFNYY